MHRSLRATTIRSRLLWRKIRWRTRLPIFGDSSANKASTPLLWYRRYDFFHKCTHSSNTPCSNQTYHISQIGDAPKKCPRYWADDEIQYDHILVQYMHSESCPYYTRREFNVTNCKLKDTIKVTQFQYNGWPTVEGEVPEVARGMIELVDQAQNHHNGQDSYASIGPVVVHCKWVSKCVFFFYYESFLLIFIC